MVFHVGGNRDGEAGAVGGQDERVAVAEAAEHAHTFGKGHVIVRSEGSLGDLHGRSTHLHGSFADLYFIGSVHIEDHLGVGETLGRGLGVYPVDRFGDFHRDIHVGGYGDLHGTAICTHLEFGAVHNHGIRLGLGHLDLGGLGAGGDGHLRGAGIIGVVLQGRSLDGSIAGLAAGGRHGEPGLVRLGRPGYVRVELDGHHVAFHGDGGFGRRIQRQGIFHGCFFLTGDHQGRQ